MNSKPFCRIILFTIILLLPSLACNAVMDFFDEEPGSFVPETPMPAEPPVEEPAPAAPFVENEPKSDMPSGYLPTTEVHFCPAVTDRILDVATQFYEEDVGDENGEEPPQLYLVTYSVSGDQISDPYFEDVSTDLAGFQEDETSHQGIWDTFITLIPLGERSSLAEYSIVTDGIFSQRASFPQ